MARWLLAMTATVALGLASRHYPAGWFLWDRVLGEVLYGTAAYLAWVALLPRRRPLVIAAAAFASCLAVELFKLTGVPAGNQGVRFVRWFLGMTFDPANLAYYLAGAAMIASADHATRVPERGADGAAGAARDRVEQG